MGKFSSRLPRSRYPAFSYEHIGILTLEIGVRRDLGNRASPVNRAHMERVGGSHRNVVPMDILHKKVKEVSYPLGERYRS